MSAATKKKRQQQRRTSPTLRPYFGLDDDLIQGVCNTYLLSEESIPSVVTLIANDMGWLDAEDEYQVTVIRYISMLSNDIHEALRTGEMNFIDEEPLPETDWDEGEEDELTYAATDEEENLLESVLYENFLEVMVSLDTGEHDAEPERREPDQLFGELEEEDNSVSLDDWLAAQGIAV